MYTYTHKYTHKCIQKCNCIRYMYYKISYRFTRNSKAYNFIKINIKYLNIKAQNFNCDQTIIRTQFFCKKELLVETWNSDAIFHDIDDTFHNMTIPMPDSMIELGSTSLYTIQAYNGIGNFTFIYYNQTIDTTSCNSMDIQQDKLSE